MVDFETDLLVTRGKVGDQGLQLLNLFIEGVTVDLVLQSVQDVLDLLGMCVRGVSEFLNLLVRCLLVRFKLIGGVVQSDHLGLQHLHSVRQI